jgi:3-hydroxymyristoyl/3-hydroxydecanoyl-(acyl carrier protein) dehydratase
MIPQNAGRHEAAFEIPVDHPALPGHFPGRPVVPGVLLLDVVISAAEQWLGSRLHVRGLRQAKFVAPLRPGEQARVTLVLAGQSLEFGVHRGDATLAKGCMTIDRAAGS